MSALTEEDMQPERVHLTDQQIADRRRWATELLTRRNQDDDA
ncbi:hypothetical protein [Nocardia thailandica]|nr:hypothetical protein [Nocardia thailandica]